MQRASYRCTEEMAATIRGIYQEASDYDTRVFSLRIPGYQRSRGVFTSRIRLSSPALAKVVETFQEYGVGHSAVDVKGRAFQKMLSPAMRAGMGQYFTPEPVVKLMVSVVTPKVHDLVLDPFCGSARFLTTSLQHVATTLRSTEEKLFHEFAFSKLHGIEKSDRMVRIAMTDMRLQGDGHSNIRCTDALLAFSNYPDPASRIVRRDTDQPAVRIHARLRSHLPTRLALTIERQKERPTRGPRTGTLRSIP